MEHIESKKSRYGLIGRNISYSFSKGYFTQKFADLGLDAHSYENFDLQFINDFPNLVQENKDLKGLNVTIPYKEAVMPYLLKLSKKAKKIGAVNTIRITKKGLKGYNTDAYGFQKAIEPFLKAHHKKALILGTGGASKAVAFVFDDLRIPYTFVSRRPADDQFGYEDLDKDVLAEYKVLVNCTPLGTHPNIEDSPDVPYRFLGQEHLLFDLIYNPEKTAFLKAGEIRGSAICNGSRMLELQAEKAWEIWSR